jgi:phosphate transport system substrate-binding protein
MKIEVLLKSKSILLIILTTSWLQLSGTSCSLNAQDFKISGSTSVQPLLLKLTEVYMKNNPDIKITVEGITSGEGINAVIEGLTDIGSASRDLIEKERELILMKEIKLDKVTIAIDGVVPIVNPANKVSNVTLDQLKDIYTGKIINWKELGGKNSPITIVTQVPQTEANDIWNKVVMKKEDTKDEEQVRDSCKEVIQAVAFDINAIGYIRFKATDSSVKALKVNGFNATEENILSNKYPVSSFLFLFIKETPSEPIQKFIDFITCTEAKMLIKNEGYVTLN